MTSPSLRKPVGVLLILAIIVVWAVLIASLSGLIGRLPFWAQIPVYLISGIIWIAPMRPLLQWMETGTLKPPTDG